MMFRRFISGLVLCGALISGAAGVCFADGFGSRACPLDMYIILDASENLGTAKPAAIRWLSSSIINKMLQKGDRLTILKAGAKAEILYSRRIQGSSEKETAADALKSLKSSGREADFAGALREAEIRQRSGIQGAIPYTLLVTGAKVRMSPAAQSHLRYARVEDFPGWRAMVAGLGIQKQVREAALAISRAPAPAN
jgi:hypothetical protein